MNKELRKKMCKLTFHLFGLGIVKRYNLKYCIHCRHGFNVRDNYCDCDKNPNPNLSVCMNCCGKMSHI